MKSIFSNKGRSNTYITFNYDEKIIKNEYQIAKIFTTFFIEIVPNLGTKGDERYLCNTGDISDPIREAIQKYKNHPSISIIKKRYLLSIKTISFPLRLLLQMIYHNK